MKTTIAAALIATAIGLLFSPLSRQYPIFHWLMYLEPALVGLLPGESETNFSFVLVLLLFQVLIIKHIFKALTPHPWGFTFEQLAQIDLTGQVALVTGTLFVR